MKHVGVRELKNSLSAYIRRVKKGETVIVTERGKEIALLKKPPGGPLEERLETLQAKGWIRIGEGGRPTGLTGRRKKVRRAPLSRAVIEDRR